MSDEYLVQLFQESIANDPATSSEAQNLLEEIYRLILCMYIFTKPGKPWYDMKFQGMNKRSKYVMERIEAILKDKPCATFF